MTRWWDLLTDSIWGGEKESVQNDSKIFDLNNWKDGAPIKWDGEV